MTLWRLLGESWPLVWPRARLREVAGDEAVVAFERWGLVRSSALAVGDRYSCRWNAEPGCAMRLVDEEGELVAVCELGPIQCLEERLAEDDAVRCHIDPESVVPVLQRRLRVPVRAVGSERRALPLGGRRVGQVDVAFALVPRPSSWVEEGWLGRWVDEDPDRVLVVLVFDQHSVPAGAPRRVRGTRVEWVALSEAFWLDSGALDLADVWLAVAPGADLEAELWPRYAFTADPARGRFCYAGRPLPLDHGPMAVRLLVELLKAAGDWVPRSQLVATLWPEAFEGTRRPTEDQVDRRLRQLKSALSAMFERLPRVAGAVVDPIENLRTKDDTAGGYRIAVPRDRVLWLSKP